MGQIKINKVFGTFKKRKEMNDKLKSIDVSCPLCKGKDLILLPSPFDEYLLCKCNTCGNMFENGEIE